MQAPTTEGRDVWDGLLRKASSEMCAALGLSPHVVVATRTDLPAARLGACVPLVGESLIQLVLLSTNSGVRTLAECLMGHEEGDEPLVGDDIKDAFSELANQFAGVAKRSLPGARDVRLGLPVFIRGTVRAPAGVSTYAYEVRWGATELVLGILTDG